MKQQGYDQLPVVDKDGRICGVVTEGNLLAKIASGKVCPGDSVSKVRHAAFCQRSLVRWPRGADPLARRPCTASSRPSP